MAPKPEEAAAIWRVLCKVRVSKVFMLYSSTCIQAWKLEQNQDTNHAQKNTARESCRKKNTKSIVAKGS
jgi:hypothetical protein